jgi:mannose-1-phosphate guanylyltransferase
MFCFRVDAALAAIGAHAGALARAGETVWSDHRTGMFDGLATVEFDPVAFAALPAVSFDYAVMEHAAGVACVRAGFDWSDIGSWQALSEMMPPDADGNRRVGRSLAYQTRNTAIHAGDRLVAVVGVDDLVIVDTPDAVLVAHRERTQDVKEIVAELKRSGDERYRFHHTTARPWGSYTVLQEGPGFKIKRIEVHPGQSLSLQMHHRRAEHWVVVSGEAVVTCGKETFSLVSNQSTFIPMATRHRLANEAKQPLVMIEVQCGDYLGEDDIVRFEDRYGRAAR